MKLNLTLQENVVFVSKKAAAHDTCEVNFMVSPLQCRICDVYCGIYYIKMAI